MAERAEWGDKLDRIMKNLQELKISSDCLREGNNEIKEQIKGMSSRLGLIEDKVEKYEGMIKEVAEESRKQKEEILHLKKANQQLLDKIADLADRSRRANIRLRGGGGEDFQIKENLKEDIVIWLQTLTQISSEQIERVHWAYRGKKTPQDILIKFTKESDKEWVFQKLKKFRDLNFGGKKVWPLLDLSPETLSKRAEMREITSTLQKKGQRYTWAFPATLIIYKNNNLYKASNLKSGRNMLRKLRLVTEGGALDGTEESDKEEEPQSSTWRNERSENVKDTYRTAGQITELEARDVVGAGLTELCSSQTLFVVGDAKDKEENQGQEKRSLRDLKAMTLQQLREYEKEIRELKRQKLREDSRRMETRSTTGI